MEVDNLSHSDSIVIILRKNSVTPAEMFGIAVLNNGILLNAYYAYIEEDEYTFTMDNTQLPSGVSQIVLFNTKGEILCDRLIFTGLNRLLNSELLDIKSKTGKAAYRPHELVNMDISVADREANPVSATFSLSVRDGANEVECNQNILTDLLLMSEIKGYVRNPSYYFEKKDDTVETWRAASLDVLLMVQGWRRYSWNRMTGIEPFEIKYLPEQGIETHGNVVSFVKRKPQSNVDVSLWLQKRSENNDSTGGSFLETFVTDDQGRFSFVSDVRGRWSMILRVTEKGKKKDHQILLDRVFSPDPKKYRYADLQVSIAEKESEHLDDEETPADLEDDFDFITAYKDSIAKLGIDEKVHHIPEVTIKGKRNSKEQDIFRNRSTSVAYYDVTLEMDNLFDRGVYVGKDIHELLINMNKNFTISRRYEDFAMMSNEFLLYKQRMPLFIVNYKPLFINDFEFDYFHYTTININAIKSIYINETPDISCQYCTTVSECCHYDFVIFIETYPEVNAI